MELRRLIGFLSTILIIVSHFKLVFGKSRQPREEYYEGAGGPSFVGEIQNVTVKAGRDAVLHCHVKNLGEYKVGWLKASDQTILTLHKKVITHNWRIYVTHDDQRTWSLHIRQISEADAACYMCQLNTANMKKQVGCIEVLVPPDVSTENTSSDVVVIEGQHTNLTCVASGNPKPTITWKREDGEEFIVRDGKNRKKVTEYSGELLQLHKVRRNDIGPFLCIASNGVLPIVSKRILLNVNFPPSVKVDSQLVGCPLGEMVTLSCSIETYPNSLSYWIRNTEARGTEEMVVKGGTELIIDEKKQSFKTILTLTIRSFSKSDIGTYTCISSNSLGRNEATIRVYEIWRQTGDPLDGKYETSQPWTTTEKPLTKVLNELTTPSSSDRGRDRKLTGLELEDERRKKNLISEATSIITPKLSIFCSIIMYVHHFLTQ